MAEYDSENKKVIGTIQDITDRKNSEIALAAEKERLLVTLRSIGDAVVTTDIHGRILIMNEVAENLTGWLQSEIQGERLEKAFRIINGISREPCENPIEKVLSSGDTIELENNTILISRDGSERIISDSGAPIRDDTGKILGVVLVFRDMTEKYKLQEVTQRVSKLESLGVLAGGIAHDFNNLLGAIFGYLELAISATHDPKITRYCGKALDALERTRGLTHQLLTFAKGGAPIMEVRDLFPFVKEVALFALSGSSISCSFEIEEDLWSCNFDRNQLGQVVDNIVINAQQAMPDGANLKIVAKNISLSEESHPPIPAGDYVCLSFCDEGTGIPKHTLSHIFEPFFTTKEKGLLPRIC